MSPRGDREHLRRAHTCLRCRSLAVFPGETRRTHPDVFGRSERLRTPRPKPRAPARWPATCSGASHG